MEENYVDLGELSQENEKFFMKHFGELPDTIQFFEELDNQLEFYCYKCYKYLDEKNMRLG